MPDIDWKSLALLMGSVLVVALYGLTASGHFPFEHRPAKLREGLGAVVLWGTMIVTGLGAVAALVLGWRSLPWYVVVLGGGAALLFAPLILQPLPDSVVNGRRGLLLFAMGAVVLTGMLWLVA